MAIIVWPYGTPLSDMGNTLPGQDDLAVADGGTGASTALGARENLEVPDNTETFFYATAF